MYTRHAVLVAALTLALLPVSLALADDASFTNPLNDSGPDPWVTWYDEHYYLAATTWGDASVGLTMRQAKTISELKTAEPVQIWKRCRARGTSGIAFANCAPSTAA